MINESELIDLYKSGESVDVICTRYKMGKLKVKSILTSAGVSIRRKGGVVRFKHEYQELLIPANEGCFVIAVCRKTGKEFTDYSNQSGVLTRHLKDLGYPILKSFEGVSFYRKNGHHWYQQYFDFVQQPIESKPSIVCRICQAPFKSNKGGHLTHHIESSHKSTIKEYLATFPDEMIHFKEQHVKSKIICQLCGQEMRVISNTHLRIKHNTTAFDYKTRFPTAPMITEDLKVRFANHAAQVNINMVRTYVSSGEKEIITFLEGLGVKVEKNNRKLLKGTEIDIYLPEYKIGIEYNGVRFHSERYGKKSSTFHLDKTLKAHEAGISLIHIFEDEWVLTKNIVKTKLKHLINLNNASRIQARKCTVTKLTSKEADSFLHDNHIQGKVKSTYYLGLYHQSVLVAVMTFTKKKEGLYDLSRYATHNDYVVLGAAGKLMQYFIRTYNPTQIISFADRRWTLEAHDNMYTKLGFRFSGSTKPDYKYFKSSYHRVKRHHKFGFRKKILLRKYPNLVNDTMTEREMTTTLGFDRIWDCGLFKYTLDVNKAT